MAEPIVSVVFRRMHEGEILALFPYESGSTQYSHLVTCYQHVGQHGAADYNLCIRTSRPATPVEYAPLLRELTSAPFNYRLNVIWRRGSRRGK